MCLVPVWGVSGVFAAAAGMVDVSCSIAVALESAFVCRVWRNAVWRYAPDDIACRRSTLSGNVALSLWCYSFPSKSLRVERNDLSMIIR